MLDIAWDTDLVLKAAVVRTQEHQFNLSHRHFHETIETSHDYCKNIIAIHSKSFYLASAFLPREKRKAIRALYAFCRTSDDIIDIQGKDGESNLKIWRNCGMNGNPRANDPVSIVWADTRKKFKIPSKYAHQLLDGVAKDVHINRYDNFSDLVDYCYGVASTVGLMSMHIIGFSDKTATRYAIKLGVALQLTNILRDIAEDYRMGRVYLPQDELLEYGITDRHLREGIVDENWIAFMKFQISRARHIYEEALPGIALLHPSGRLPIAAASTFYQGILSKIEENNYDVFSSRASLSKWRKIKLLPKLWFKYQLASRLS